MPDNDSNLPPGFVIQGAEPSSASGIPASGLPPGFVIQNPGPSQQPISSPQPPSSLPPGFGVQNSPNNGQPAEPAKHLYQDDTQPWYKRAGDWLDTPITESIFGLPETRPGAGGFERGVEHIASGLTSPLSIGLTAATFGTGGLLESAGMTALKQSGEFTAEELPQILKAAKVAVDTYKAVPEGATAVADAVRDAGVDPALWNRAQSFLHDTAHLTEHDLLGGNLMERGAFQILHKVAPDLPVAATVRAAKTANTMLNAGFTFQQLESASAMSPRFLDAIKEGDSDKAWEYGTEMFASGTLGILGASHALHSAGELFKPLIENDAFRPNDHWLQIDRANKEREAQHAVAEQEDINLDRAIREILGHADPGFLETVFGGSEEAKNRKNLELATVFHNVVTGGDRVKAAQWYNTLSEALGKEDRLPVPGESGPNNGQPPIGQVNVESAPGAEFAESLPGYAKATPEEKATYHQEKMQIVKDALRASGFQIVGEDTGHGYWGGASNPVTGFHVAGDPATIESAAKLVHQVLGDQNSIGYTIPRGPSLEGNELEFNFEHPLTAEEVSKIGKNLDESGVSAYPEASDPRRLRIINYSGEHTAPSYTDGIVGLVHDALPDRPLSPITNRTESNLVEQGTPSPVAEKARQAVGELNRERGFNRALGTPTPPPTREGTKVVHSNDAGEVRVGEDGRPVVWLSPEAWTEYSKIAHPRAKISGASYSSKEAADVAKSLLEANKSPESQKVLDLFQKAQGLSKQNLLTTARTGTDVTVVAEELQHTWQRELSEDGEIRNHLDPHQWDKLSAIIPRDWAVELHLLGYSDDPVTRVAETAAQFRAGNTKGLVSATDVTRFLDAYYSEIEAKHGGNVIESARKINDVAAQHVKDIYEDRGTRQAATESGVADRQTDSGQLPRVETRREAGTPEVGPTERETETGLASREEEQEYSKLSRLRLRGGMGDPGSAGLITGDNEVFVGRYHDDLAEEAGYKLPDNGRGNLHDMFFRDGGVRIRGAGGVIHIDFMDPNADTWDRVYQAIRSVPDANRYFVDFRPIKNGTGFNIDAYDKDSLLFRLKDLEEGKERPAAPGSVAYFRNGMFSREGDYRDKEPRFPGLRPNGSRSWEEIKPFLNDEITKHDTPEKQNALTAAFNSLPDHQDYVEAIRAGRAGQMWYERSSRAFDALMDAGIDSLTKKDKPKFLNFVAALSPVQAVRQNLLMALNLWGKWDKAGRPTDVEWKDGVANKNASLYRILKGRGNTQGVDLPARMNNAIRALQGEPLSGPKVSAFTTNLGADADRVTNDTWMAVFGGHDPNRINKPAVYDAMSAKIREAADATGIAPRQAQAAVWSFIKSLAELSGWGNDRWIPPQEIIKQRLLTPELVGMHSADFADLIQNDPEIRDAIKAIGGDLNVLDRKIKSYVPGKPAEGGPAEPTPQLLSAAERLEGARRDSRVANHLARKQEGGLFDTDFRPNNGLFSRDEETPQWYLKSNSLIDQRMQGPMPADTVLKMLENNGVKPDELKYTGLAELLHEKGKEPVRPEELKKFLDANNLQIKEVTKSGTDIPFYGTEGEVGSGGPTKFGTYTLPGAVPDSYREMLLTLPKQTASLSPVEGMRLRSLNEQLHGMDKDEDPQAYMQFLRERNQLLDKDTQLRNSSYKESFRGSHWDEPNVVGHVRFNDRVGPNGEKLLHLEELQSDWHQKGRTAGYRGEPSAEDVAKYGEAQARSIQNSKIPDAPFKKTWPELLMKRMVRYAAEHGYDGVSWTPGAEQADRYSLAHVGDEVRYHPESRALQVLKDGKLVEQINDVAPQALPDQIGKEAASRLLSTPLKPTDTNQSNYHAISGEDLKVGGAGMKGFYDKIVPELANKLGKQFGAKVGETKASVGNLSRNDIHSYTGPELSQPDISQLYKDIKEGRRANTSLAEGTNFVNRSYLDQTLTQIAAEMGRGHSYPDAVSSVLANNKTLLDNYAKEMGGEVSQKKYQFKKVPYFPITDSMRESVMKQGQPLFSKESPNNGQLQHQIDTNVFKNQPKDYQDLVMDSLRRNAMGELSDREIQASNRLKDEQDKNYEIGSSNDLLHHYIEDYMTRVYKDTNPAGNAILSDAKGGKFATNVTMAKKRVYDSNLTALLMSPKQMLLDPVSITARGRASLIKAAANRQLIDNLRDKFTRASDGRPAVVLSGSGKVISGQNGEDPSIFVDPNRVRKINIDPKVIEQMSASGDLDKYLANGTLRDITPYVRPNNIGAAVDRLEEQAGRSTPIPDEHGQNPLRTQIMLLKSMQANGDFRGLKDFNDALTKKYAWDPQDYVSLANNAMKGWNFITNSPDGTPVYVRSDIKVHPEFAEYLQNRLGLKESDIAKNPVGKALLGAGSKLKHTLLSLSPFHMVQEALRGIMVGINPFHITGPDILTGEKIDPSDPNSPTIIRKAVENGFTTGTDYKSLQANSEGLSSGGGILDKIPGVGKVIGNSLNWYQDFLFKRYIPALKARSVELMYHEYQRLHPDWSVDRVAKAAALHTNDTFGGINWKAMGRSATTQDWGRLMFLAPDWLESEMRSGARLFNKDEGGLGRAQVAKMALGLWGIARVLNLVTTGNAHYEAPFGLATKNKEGKETVFSIRTLPTDLLHAASDPVGFIKGRLSPTVRMGEELVSGRDQFGRKLQPSDLWVDIFRSMAPIPLQAAGQALSGQGPDVGNIGQTVKAVGGTATVYRTPAQKMAADLASDRTESGPVDPASMERHHRIIQLEDQARAGEVSWPDLYKLTYATDQLHPDELKKIETNVKETHGMDPGVAALYSRASRLPAKDYLDLLDVMNNSEKAALAPLTLKVQKRYLNAAKKNMTPEERQRDPTFNRFLNMVPGQHPGPISQTAPPIPAPVQQEAAHLYRAINPDTGHRIVHDGSQWRDAETGVAV